ncbi:MAG: AMP-binding protein, partial [Rhizobiales bacterium]|nr:AMP-binding protein [Hyphomicrobiales bacterium]
MQDYTVSINYEVTPSKISFSPKFNAVVAFIDRHVLQGRGDQIALKTEHADISYDELLANVNRFGNALKDLGLKKGDRVLMVVVDEPQLMSFNGDPGAHGFFGMIHTDHVAQEGDFIWVTK